MKILKKSPCPVCGEHSYVDGKTDDTPLTEED